MAAGAGSYMVSREEASSYLTALVVISYVEHSEASYAGCQAFSQLLEKKFSEKPRKSPRVRPEGLKMHQEKKGFLDDIKDS